MLSVAKREGEKEMTRRLRRVRDKEWIGGVCAGFGYWLGIPAWVIRLVLVIATFSFAIPAIIYLLLWWLMPAWSETPDNYEKVTGE